MVKVPEKPPAYLCREDFGRLISAIEKPWLKDLVVVAVSTGLRRGELLNLRWVNVDFANRLIHIQSSDGFRTKAGKRRAVPMNESVYHLLWNRSLKSKNDLVFPFKGRIMRGDLLSRRFRLAVKAAGLNPALHFHSLRHTFATWLVQERISIYEVQKLLGHSSIAITQIYSHLAPSELHHAVNKIELPTN
jgi:integrase